MNCEYCGNEHEGSFATGRFCNRKCSNGFSTKAKRQEINKKVSIKLTKPLNFCLNCNKKTKRKKFCSRRCSNNYNRETFSLKRIEAIKQGKTNFNSIKCEFCFNGKKIRCDSKIEYSCLDYFVKNYKVKDINRCEDIIEYSYKDKKRRFLPDFNIDTLDKNKFFVVEAKSFISSKNLNKKWHFYNETSILKKEALIKYCKENNKEPFWFTKNLNIKHYNSFIPV